ncbi:hypothetical protein TNCV_4938201 [Trichonephila clavipes]|nr:hypothetical protein TNCV_4938201 [Trichonephila clavipes]
MLFLSRRDSISGEKPTSFPKKIQQCLTRDSNEPEPIRFQDEGHSHHTGWATLFLWTTFSKDRVIGRGCKIA